jgi:CBS domain containing-hemolysin-like protein
MTLLVLIVVTALSISFVCSVLEAALFSARTPELLARREGGDRGAALLLELKTKRMDDAISAILILNTIAHTIGAALAGAQAAVVFGDRWVGVFSGVLTLLVLVATEIIPKTLGATYASALVGLVARTVKALTVVLAPLLMLSRSLTRLVGHAEPTAVSRAEVGALVALATRQGALQHDESRVVSNVLRAEGVTVADVMTPRTVVAMAPQSLPLQAFLDDTSIGPYSRVPLFENSRDNVVGYVTQRDALRAAREPDAGDGPISRLARPIRHVPETAKLGVVLRQLIENGEHIAVVHDEFGVDSGVVTLEDLVETILGVEIVDESDPVPDLRELAKKIRDERLQRNRQRWGEAPSRGSEGSLPGDSGQGRL